MTRRLVVPGALTLTVVLGISACAGTRSQPKPQPSLYARLGGKPAITAVVDDFVANVAADARINERFAKANIPRLKTMLIDQLCEATGGPCTYTGKSMAEAHKGMHIREAEFDALVEDLVKSLDKLGVRPQEKNELLSALGAMKPQIVGQ